MRGLYPQRFIALLESMITDGMDRDEIEEWNKEMRQTDDVDANSPLLDELIQLGQAVDTADAAMLVRLGEKMARAQESGDESRIADIQSQMNSIRARAMEATFS